MIEIKNENDLLNWLKQNQDKLQGKTIRLHGEMGSGKTTLVRLFVSLFSDKEVSSPTFAVHHQYSIDNKKIDHFDLFRIENDEALEGVGFWDVLKNSETIFIEWPEKVRESLWPQDRSYTDLFLELKDSSRFLRWLSL